MANLSFPADPTVGQTYTPDGLFVIYTWNGEYWEANSVNSFDSRYVEVDGDNMTGDLTLGTIPAAPNITLTASGVVTTTKGFYAERPSGDDLANVFRGKLDGNITSSIKGEGSAEFAGKVISGLDPGDGANVGAKMNKGSGFLACRDNSSSPLFRGYKIATASPTFEVLASGSATFAGAIQVSNINTSASSGASGILLNANGSAIAQRSGDGPIFQGYKGNSEKFYISADGSATFASDITSTTRIQTLKDNGNKTSTLGGSTTYAFSASDDGGTRNIQLNYDGSATFGGGLVTSSTTNSGCSISTSGALSVQRTSGSNVILRGYNKNTQTSYILADGSGYFASNIDTYTYGSSQADQGARVGNGVVFLKRAASDTAKVFQIRTGNNNDKVSFLANGTADFKGVVTSADSFAIQLEADDDTKYTATTDADGNETRVYNGATLDVKDRLQKTDAALAALKTAAAAAVDFAALKSAIASALADI